MNREPFCFWCLVIHIFFVCGEKPTDFSAIWRNFPPQRNRKFLSVGVSFRNSESDPNLETTIETMGMCSLTLLIKYWDYARIGYTLLLWWGRVIRIPRKWIGNIYLLTTHLWKHTKKTLFLLRSSHFQMKENRLRKRIRNETASLPI